MTDDLDRLAVYGTLVPGGRNADVLDELAGEWTLGTVRGTRLDAGWRGYPGVVLDEHGGTVEVAVLTSAALAGVWERLDTFEGPGYRRVVADVTLEDGRVVPAHVYELADPPDLDTPRRPAPG